MPCFCVMNLVFYRLSASRDYKTSRVYRDYKIVSEVQFYVVGWNWLCIL